MSTPVYKILLFLKRRPGMSMEDFIDYYENTHRKLGEKYSAGVKRYIRRFLTPIGGEGELPYDVITELWFEDRAVFEQVKRATSEAILPEEVIEDEKRLFDRSKSRTATIVEYESNLPG